MQTRRCFGLTAWMAAAALSLCALPQRALGDNQCLQNCTTARTQCTQNANADYAACTKSCKGANFKVCAKDCTTTQSHANSKCEKSERSCEMQCKKSQPGGGKPPSGDGR